MKSLFIFSALLALLPPCYATEENGVVYQPINSGVEITFTSDGSDWLKIQSIGEADMNIGDRTDERQATKKATLRAKADLAKFMNERITSEETSEEITKLTQTASTDGNTISKESNRRIVDSTIERIVSQSSAILKGVMPLETRIDNNKGCVRVVVGISRKSINTANSLRNELQKEYPANRTTESKQDGVVIRRSTNYDNY